MGRYCITISVVADAPVSLNSLPPLSSLPRKASPPVASPPANPNAPPPLPPSTPINLSASFHVYPFTPVFIPPPSDSFPVAPTIPSLTPLPLSPSPRNNSSASPPVAPPSPALIHPLPLTRPSSPPSSRPIASPPPMDSQPSNSTESPASEEPPPPDNTPDERPPSSSPPPPDASSLLPPSPSNNAQPPPSPSAKAPDPPPPPPKSPETSPPPPKSPETSPPPPKSSQTSPSPPTPSQQTPENVPPTPPSQRTPQSPPETKTMTPPTIPSPGPQSNESENSPPSPTSGNSNLSGSPPSPSSPGPPPGGQLTPNPLILSPSSPSLTPAHTGSNSVSSISESNGGGIGTNGVVAIGLVCGLLLLGVIGLTVWCFWYRKKKVNREVGPEVPTVSGSSQSGAHLTPFKYALLKKRSSPANASREFGYESASETPGMGTSKNLYSYKELSKATNKFSERNLLGEGGFGSVFKGLLPDGREVAVKQLKDGGGQGEREFRAEVETISRIHHRHLVSLVGYCISNEKRLLVYDYVPNNTLYFHLHGQGEASLDWPMRIKIATGAARGIAYLHEDCHPRIVHRDIKSSNILLDKNFEAQVSDFGLARLFSDSNTHVTTRVMGTFGYMAPEYASSGKLTDKSDVFSFGVVLLELITGRKPVDKSQPTGEESLVEWARPLLKDALDKENFEKLVDPRLRENYVDSEMFRMIEAASACVRYSALRRPKMSQVLRAFDDISLSDLDNGMRVGESEIIEAAEQSAEIRLFQRMAFGSQDYSTDFFTQGYLESEEN